MSYVNLCYLLSWEFRPPAAMLKVSKRKSCQHVLVFSNSLLHRAQVAEIYSSYIAMNATNMDGQTCFEWGIKITAKLIILPTSDRDWTRH